MSCLTFYDQHYTKLFEPLLGMMLGGIRIDVAAAKRRHDELSVKIEALRQAVQVQTGLDLWGKTSLSNAKLRDYVYGDLRVKPIIKRATGKPTLDEVALQRLILKYPEKLRQLGGLILRIRRYEKLQDFLAEKLWDADGRVRCAYTFNTESGRLSSRQNPKRRGMNLQNVDREVRDVFLPDEGCVFLEVDLSQAEARDVYIRTGDRELIRLARTAPWEFDQHTYNAALIFGVAEQSVSKEQRFLGKVSVHGAQRDMHGGRLAETLLKADPVPVVKTDEECQRMIDRYHAKFPQIKEWHQRVRSRVMRDRKLTSAWGRVIDFTYDRLSDELYRRAYSWYPQSDIGDWTNQRGVVPFSEWRWADPRTRLAAQVHDSLLICTPPANVYNVASIMERELTKPLMVEGIEMAMFVEFKLGSTWKPTVEYKRLPDRAEMEGVAYELARGTASDCLTRTH